LAKNENRNEKQNKINADNIIFYRKYKKIAHFPEIYIILLSKTNQIYLKIWQKRMKGFRLFYREKTLTI
jgi:hypothetical protein